MMPVEGTQTQQQDDMIEGSGDDPSISSVSAGSPAASAPQPSIVSRVTLLSSIW